MEEVQNRNLSEDEILMATISQINISKAYYKKEHELQLEILAAILFKYQNHLRKFRIDTGFF